MFHRRAARKHKSLKELLDDAVTRDITLGDLDNATDEDATLIKKVKADVHANEYFIDITRAAEGVMKWLLLYTLRGSALHMASVLEAWTQELSRCDTGTGRLKLPQAGII